MGFYCLVLLKISLELVREDPVYQDTASKFFEHFLRIARAMAGDYRGGLFGGNSNWRDHILFNEYFHGDNGAGLGLPIKPVGQGWWPN